MADIVIDPGHGGSALVGRSTPLGVRGPRGTLEKDVALALAHRVVQRLGARAALTRTHDVNLSLGDRAAVARRSDARVFLSLHANEGCGGERGSEAFVHPRGGGASRSLAGELQRSLSRLGGPANLPRSAELAVLTPSHHGPNTAACLLEIDYLSHPDVERKLSRPDELDRLGGAIAGAILRHLSPAHRSVALDDEPVVTPAGEPITSGNITVGGKHFVDWFNEDFQPTQTGNHPTLQVWRRPAPKFPHRLQNRAAFRTIFDNCAELWAPVLSQAEFLALACIIYNETGGTFSPASERGSEKYMFERSAAGKASYNASPNRPAGDLLRDRGVLDPGDAEAIAAWNSTTTYPNPTDETLIYQAHQCDFWKYRGRGLIQLTWRPKYLSFVDPLLAANGYAACDELSEEELGNIILTDHRIYLPMVKGFLSAPALAAKLAKVNETPPSWSPLGQAVSGSPDYGALLQWRCETLKAAMDAAGWHADVAAPIDGAETAQGLGIARLLDEDQDGAPTASDSPDPSATGATASDAPTPSASELLDFTATADTMEALRADSAAYRQRVVDVISAFNGFGVDDRPAGRRAAYGDLLAWGESAAMRDSLLQKTLANSSCGLVIRSAWRLLGVRDPLLDPPYKPGSVITNLVAYARQCGAFNDAKTVDSVQRGDVILIVEGNRQHIFTVIERDGDTVTSLDGGQAAPQGSGLDDGGCNSARKRVRTFAADHRSFAGDTRAVWCWIDVEKLRFSAPIIQPVRGSSPDLPNPDPS
jgi:hypothetical protein